MSTQITARAGDESQVFKFTELLRELQLLSDQQVNYNEEPMELDNLTIRPVDDAAVTLQSSGDATPPSTDAAQLAKEPMKLTCAEIAALPYEERTVMLRKFMTDCKDELVDATRTRESVPDQKIPHYRLLVRELTKRLDTPSEEGQLKRSQELSDLALEMLWRIRTGQVQNYTSTQLGGNVLGLHNRDDLAYISSKTSAHAFASAFDSSSDPNDEFQSDLHDSNVCQEAEALVLMYSWRRYIDHIREHGILDARNIAFTWLYACVRIPFVRNMFAVLCVHHRYMDKVLALQWDVFCMSVSVSRVHVSVKSFFQIPVNGMRLDFISSYLAVCTEPEFEAFLGVATITPVVSNSIIRTSFQFNSYRESIERLRAQVAETKTQWIDWVRNACMVLGAYVREHRTKCEAIIFVTFKALLLVYRVLTGSDRTRMQTEFGEVLFKENNYEDVLGQEMIA